MNYFERFLWRQVNILATHQGISLSAFKRRKLSCFGQVCHHDRPPKIMPRGTVDDSHRRERPCKLWMDNIKEWTGQASHCRRCSASQTIEVIGRTLQWRCLLEYPSDAWASQVLCSLIGSNCTRPPSHLPPRIEILPLLYKYCSIRREVGKGENSYHDTPPDYNSYSHGNDTSRQLPRWISRSNNTRTCRSTFASEI